MRLTVTGANGRVATQVIKVANQRSLTVNAVVRASESAANSNIETFTNIMDAIQSSDVVIDFTTPLSSLEFARDCAKSGKAIVIGTTGFSNDQISELEQLANEIPILWSSNMSLGINLMLKLSQEAAKILGESYDVEIMEAHHRNKVDAPSGTALMTGKAIADTLGKNFDDIKDLNRQQEVRARRDGSIGFSSIRAGNLAGSLNVMFASDNEIFELKHQAMDRAIYAEGALKAAKWLLKQQPGKLYHTLDMFEHL